MEDRWLLAKCLVTSAITDGNLLRHTKPLFPKSNVDKQAVSKLSFLQLEVATVEFTDNLGIDLYLGKPRVLSV